MKTKDILITGAGPTGLAAALFLHQHGLAARIFEKHIKQTTFSKALGINARTLKFFEPSGVTERLIDQGNKVFALNFYISEKRVAHLDLTKAKNKYNYMLVLPQAKTEAILTETILSKGIKIDRGITLEHVKISEDDIVRVNTIDTSGHFESTNVDCLFAADGAHSTVRDSLGITMIGDEYPEPWFFQDLELDTKLPTDQAHVFLTDKGGLFMLCIESNVWRIGGNLPNILENLPTGTVPGKSIWSTQFIISHKYSEEFSKGPVYFAGDAAHLHSPIGARGMNLGVEDAYIFAELAARDKLDMYASMRQPVAKKVVDTVRRMTAVPRGKSFMSHIIRNAPFLPEIALPLFSNSLRQWAMGTDHKLGL